jgi:hypothetical protein
MMQYTRKFADSIALALPPLHRIPHWQTSNPSKETTLSFAKMPQYVFTFLASSEAPHPSESNAGAAAGCGWVDVR